MLFLVQHLFSEPQFVPVIGLCAEDAMMRNHQIKGTGKNAVSHKCQELWELGRYSSQSCTDGELKDEFSKRSRMVAVGTVEGMLAPRGQSQFSGDR
jgi:hypothetical protein